MRIIKDFNHNVHYMQNLDFDKSGNLRLEKLTEIPKNMLVLIMIQSSDCKFCEDAKFDFQDFANIMSGKVFCATIQINGYKEPETEIPLGKRFKELEIFNGVPEYVLYKNGRHIATLNSNNRDVNELTNFCNTYL